MVKIITDTSADLSVEMAASLGVILIPMTIQFGDKSFKDRIEMEAQEFYKLLISYDDLPKTSQVNPYTFGEVFEKETADGSDLIVITLSSDLSGTFQNATMAADDYDNVYVIDSRTVAVSQQCLVRLACELRDKDVPASEIADVLKREADNVRVLGLLETMEYLKKGGRISPAVAAIGNLLSIKPVVTTKEGVVSVEGKARGSKNANNLLKKLIADCGGIDYSKPIVLGYSGTSMDLLQQYIDDNTDLYEGILDELNICQIGSTIGTHVGPGAVAIGFFPLGTK